MSSRIDTWQINLNEDDQGDTDEQLKKVVKCRRRVFTPEEDKLLTELVSTQTCTNWIEVSQAIPGRTPRQCRDRWINYLSPANSFAEWTSEEDQQIIDYVNQLGTKWMSIAKLMPGRSDNTIKNRWYSSIKKRCVVLHDNQYRLKGSKRIHNQVPAVARAPRVIPPPTQNFAISEPVPIEHQPIYQNVVPSMPVNFVPEQTVSHVEPEQKPTTMDEDDQNAFWDRAIANQLSQIDQDPFDIPDLYAEWF